MPVHRGEDSHGTFYQWGKAKKYYYTNNAERTVARAKAARQGRAIEWRKHIGAGSEVQSIIE